jgi:ion channel POLLUX/CASTOR
VGPDTQTIKTLLSLASFCRDTDEATPAPLVVAELVDARNVVTARRAYPGPLEAIATEAVVSSLLCQNIRHPGVSHVYSGLLTHGDGSEIYARDCPDHFVGKRFGDLVDAFPRAILLGLVRRGTAGDDATLNPSDDVRIAAGDRLVLVAEELEDTQAPADYEPKRPDRGEGIPSPPRLQAFRRILILGWSHQVPRLLDELDTYRGERFEVVVGSIVPIATRVKQIQEHGVTFESVHVRHEELDFTIATQLRAADPASFHNIVFVASDRIEFEEADARTILGHLLLREIVPDHGEGPHVLVELADPENLALFQRGSSEVLIPAVLVSHMLAQIALRPELRVVFEDLFGPHGPEIFFRPAEEYGLAGKEVDFETIRRAVADQNETPLGLRLPGPGSAAEAEIVLNPPRDERWRLRDGDELIVVATYES